MPQGNLEQQESIQLNLSGYVLFYHLNFIWLLQHMSEADADDSTISNVPWRNAEQKVFSSRGMVRAAQYCRVRSIQKCSQHPLPGTSSITKCEDRAVEDVKTHKRARAVGQMRFRFSSLSWLEREVGFSAVSVWPSPCSIPYTSSLACVDSKMWWFPGKAGYPLLAVIQWE